ncbi:MAG: hypothetical protein ACJ8J0_11755 [Longimicrobiaceae bacterium]
MKKLQLSLEDLAVETFCASDQGTPGRGTVKGNQIYTYFCNTDEPECNTSTCNETSTCGDSDIYHCPETHDAWDYGSCAGGSCLDSCDTFCAWTTPCYC